ncbi:hypothetical protein O3M35_001745 [Rhynocoris fuscipes]|uniref:Protein takeout-like n=1 Tax=Rhynocoris fuscipes TaxID=488301 RepID=A0AAW1CW83_9HEMI
MIKLLLSSFVILFAVYEQVGTLPLPSYLKICHVGPEFNDCIIKTTNDAIPTVIKGDRKYRYPPFNPLVIEKIEVTENSKKSIAMNVTLSDAKFSGLDKAKMIKSNFDVNKKHMEFVFIIPKLVIDCHYKLNGQFLIVPIFGDGPGHIVLDNPEITVVLDYNLVNRKGEEHISIIKETTQLKYKAEGLHVDLKNLFNGDEALSKNMLASLNENWKELLNALGPGIADGIKQVIVGILDELTTLIPYKEIVQQ